MIDIRLEWTHLINMVSSELKGFTATELFAMDIEIFISLKNRALAQIKKRNKS